MNEDKKMSFLISNENPIMIKSDNVFSSIQFHELLLLDNNKNELFQHDKIWYVVSNYTLINKNYAFINQLNSIMDPHSEKIMGMIHPFLNTTALNKDEKGGMVWFSPNNTYNIYDATTFNFSILDEDNNLINLKELNIHCVVIFNQ